MAANQHNATGVNPNGLELTEIATYERRIGASLERVWENVLDWEHLPWLHRTSFDFVAVDEAGEWGWRTFSKPDHSAHIELCVDKPNQRYVARSYTNNAQVSEIWTYLQPVDDATDIRVTFALPDIETHQVEKLGTIYRSLYQKLWDEDEAMMVERQAQLDSRARGPAEVILGRRDELQFPLTVPLGRGKWLVREVGGDILVHSATCPHLLGPLDGPVEEGSIQCPWHGYTFDLATGQCVSPAEARCRLPAPPVAQETEGIIKLVSLC